MTTTPRYSQPRRGRRLAWLIVPAAIIVFIGANAHLIYVAFQSHPGCVPHLKEAGVAPGQFRSATSDC